MCCAPHCGEGWLGCVRACSRGRWVGGVSAAGVARRTPEGGVTARLLGTRDERRTNRRARLVVLARSTPLSPARASPGATVLEDRRAARLRHVVHGQRSHELRDVLAERALDDSVLLGRVVERGLVGDGLEAEQALQRGAVVGGLLGGRHGGGGYRLTVAAPVGQRNWARPGGTSTTTSFGRRIGGSDTSRSYGSGLSRPRAA